MGEERRSCAAAGAPEGARGTQGQAAQVALQGGPGFPGAERNGAETQLRPTRKRDVGAPRRRAAQRNAAEQRGSPVGWAGSNLSRRSFRRSLRRRDGRRRNPCGRTERGRIPKSALEGNLRRRSPPGADESRPCGQRSQGQRRKRRKGGAGAGCPEGSEAAVEPEGQSATGADAGSWTWSLRNASCRRERTGRLPGGGTKASLRLCGPEGRSEHERVLPEPAEAVPRSGTELPEAGAGAVSNR